MHMTVTDLDREAAATFYRTNPLKDIFASDIFALNIMIGNVDDAALVQAFAAHRLATIEQCAKIVEDISDAYCEAETGWLECCETVAQAIRALTEGGDE